MCNPDNIDNVIRAWNVVGSKYLINESRIED
jgi:hypothetical protein